MVSLKTAHPSNSLSDGRSLWDIFKFSLGDFSPVPTPQAEFCGRLPVPSSPCTPSSQHRDFVLTRPSLSSSNLPVHADLLIQPSIDFSAAVKHPYYTAPAKTTQSWAGIPSFQAVEVKSALLPHATTRCAGDGRAFLPLLTQRNCVPKRPENLDLNFISTPCT
jgi:hypothetical protein